MKNDTGLHYRRKFRGYNLDPARICEVYEITNVLQGTLVKKALCMGERGHKSQVEDLLDIITAADRMIEMILENEENQLGEEE
jgi:hypothetical protein